MGDSSTNWQQFLSGLHDPTIQCPDNNAACIQHKLALHIRMVEEYGFHYAYWFLATWLQRVMRASVPIVHAIEDTAGNRVRTKAPLILSVSGDGDGDALVHTVHLHDGDQPCTQSVTYRGLSFLTADTVAGAPEMFVQLLRLHYYVTTQQQVLNAGDLLNWYTVYAIDSVVPRDATMDTLVQYVTTRHRMALQFLYY